MEKAADAAADRAHTRFIVSDDPEEIVEGIARLRRPRLHRARLPLPRGRPARQIDAFADDVLPRLRDRFADALADRCGRSDGHESCARAGALASRGLVVVILIATVGAARALHEIEAHHQRDVVAAARTGRGDHRRRLPRPAGAPRPGRRRHRGRRRPHPAGFAVLTRQMMRTPEVGAIGLIDRVTERDRAAWERRYGVG